MSDIVERLRRAAAYITQMTSGDARWVHEAADEIELLRQRLEFAEFEWSRATASWQEAEKRLSAVVESAGRP